MIVVRAAVRPDARRIGVIGWPLEARGHFNWLAA